MYTLTINCKDYDSLKHIVDRLGNTLVTTAVVNKAATVAPALPPDPAEPQTLQEKAEASGEISFAQVRQCILDVAKLRGKNTSLEILKQFNDSKGNPCEKVTALVEDDYAAVLDEAKKILEQ